MHAQVGDWIVVKSHTDSTTSRRASVVGVLGADGAPPYRVRWLDTDHEALMYPGPDAVVVTAAEQQAHDREADERVHRVQQTLAAHSGA